MQTALGVASGFLIADAISTLFSPGEAAAAAPEAAPHDAPATGDPSSGEEYWFHGSFHDVRPGELIVQTFTFEGMPDGVALEKLILEDLGGGRTRLVTTSLVDSFEDRDAFVASGMEEGVVDGYERLDELLAR